MRRQPLTGFVAGRIVEAFTRGDGPLQIAQNLNRPVGRVEGTIEHWQARQRVLQPPQC